MLAIRGTHWYFSLTTNSNNNNNKDLFPCSDLFLNTMNMLLARGRGTQKNEGSGFSGFGEIVIESAWLGCEGREKIVI